ncbi:hypothetical protein UCREL1_9040 [Eutypa lata UCREL1]|uniref:Uncharacterized protein n=1 Tax=Eutypa lata (strain UCR-EL1) TaxID=1287681 RepID=M7SI79_EUTLA|nr:hypothetical protein UCREL1_9040 [Eutypa lata UCREL1]
MSPINRPLDLEMAKKLVVIVWLVEPTLCALAELNQNKHDDFHHKPIMIHSMNARHDGYDGPAKKHAYKAYQLARVCDATDIPSLRRMILGTSQQRLGIDFREFEPSSATTMKRENHRPYSATIEFRFFTPTRDPDYSRMCIKVAAAIFALAAGPDHGLYRRKPDEILERIDRKTDRWRELLDILGLGSEVPAWENAKKQHCENPKDLEI